MHLPPRQLNFSRHPHQTCQAPATAHSKNMKTITPSELSSLSPNCLLIDVRTPAEFQEKHIPSSINIPLHTLQPEKIRSLIRQDSPCVLICGSGNRARQAAEKLQSAGISQTIILEGGIKA
ncbi:MAG: rhodanese-like domain-containing protein, partial [Methylacidiphilales bacterium]|nr:rhodanese-like domain-containing protein [Candidatus Methylacidiphilales bacterium]